MKQRKTKRKYGRNITKRKYKGGSDKSESMNGNDDVIDYTKLVNELNVVNQSPEHAQLQSKLRIKYIDKVKECEELRDALERRYEIYANDSKEYNKLINTNVILHRKYNALQKKYGALVKQNSSR